MPVEEQEEQSSEETQTTPTASSYEDFQKQSQQPKELVEEDKSTPPGPATGEKPSTDKSEPPATPEGKTTEATDASDDDDDDEKTPELPAKTPEGKIATAPGAPKQETQDTRRKRNAEERLKELHGDKEREKARADRAEKELDELRKTSAAKPPDATKPPEPSKPVAAPFSEPMPSMRKYLERQSAGEEGFADKSYEELQDLCNADLVEWQDRRAEARREKREADEAEKKAADEAAKAKTTEAEALAVRKREQDAKVALAKLKYEDYDQSIQAVIAANPNVRNAGIEAAFGEVDDMGEILYALAADKGAEYLRIAKLPTKAAYRETLRLDDRIQAAIAAAAPPKDPDAPAPPAKPEKTSTRPAVSKVPAPYTPANGVEAAGTASKAPQSYEEFRALEKKRAA